MSRSKSPKGPKRPKRYHHSREANSIHARLLRRLPNTDADVPEWGEPVVLNQKSQKPKRPRGRS